MRNELKENSRYYWHDAKQTLFTKKGFYELLAVYGLFMPIVWLLFAVAALPGYILWMLLMAWASVVDKANAKLEELKRDEEPYKEEANEP